MESKTTIDAPASDHIWVQLDPDELTRLTKNLEDATEVIREQKQYTAWLESCRDAIIDDWEIMKADRDGLREIIGNLVDEIDEWGKAHEAKIKEME